MRWRIVPVQYEEWHDWLAWYPIEIGNSIVWFETVQRKWEGFWHYRNKG